MLGHHIFSVLLNVIMSLLIGHKFYFIFVKCTVASLKLKYKCFKLSDLPLTWFHSYCFELNGIPFTWFHYK